MTLLQLGLQTILEVALIYMLFLLYVLLKMELQVI